MVAVGVAMFKRAIVVASSSSTSSGTSPRAAKLYVCVLPGLGSGAGNNGDTGGGSYRLLAVIDLAYYSGRECGGGGGGVVQAGEHLLLAQHRDAHSVLLRWRAAEELAAL